MNRILMTLCAALTLGAASAAGTTPALGDEKSLYDLLDLERPGMEAVKKAVAKGNVAAADKELLKYFRTRKPVELFGLDLENVKVNKLEQKQADEALEHKFYAHKGYQPSYFSPPTNSAGPTRRCTTASSSTKATSPPISTATTSTGSTGP